MFKQEDRGGRGRYHGRPEEFVAGHGRGARHYRGHGEGRGEGLREGRGPRLGPGPGMEGPCGHRGGRDGRRTERHLRRGPMVRRGDVRTAILTLLAEEPMHGYQIIGQLGERSGGMWRPSAGSVYPTLQQLEDEGLVKGEERDGRTVYAMTEDGKTAAARAKQGPAPWEIPGASEAADLRELVFQLGAAASQVSHVGSSTAIESARTALIEARRTLYRLLAEDDRSNETGAPAAK